MVRWLVLIQDLQHEVSSSEVGNVARQPGPAPHEPQEEGPLAGRERLQDLPEPADQRTCHLYTCTQINFNVISWLQLQK